LTVDKIEFILAAIMEPQAPQEPQLRPTSTYSAVGNGGRKKIIFSIVIIVLLLVVVGVAWYFLAARDSEEELLATPTVFEIPTEIPAPTAAVVNRQEVGVRILNASGIAGEATFLMGELTEMGYEDIEVGNAATQDATATTVTFSTELPEEVVDEITQKLTELYQTVNTTTLATTDFDVDILVGLRQGQTRATATPTPQATPTPTPVSDEDNDSTPTPTTTE
jgi:hypothetical protein